MRQFIAVAAIADKRIRAADLPPRVPPTHPDASLERFAYLRALALIGAITILMTGCVAPFPYGYGAPQQRYRAYGPYSYAGGAFYATLPTPPGDRITGAVITPGPGFIGTMDTMRNTSLTRRSGRRMCGRRKASITATMIRLSKLGKAGCRGEIPIADPGAATEQ